MSNSPPPRRLSSGTLFYKKVFPWLWVAGIAVAGTLMAFEWRGGAPDAWRNWPFLVVAVIGFLFSKLMAAGMVDEVLDGGDHILVRLDNDVERIPLKRIDKVRESLYMRQPHQIELVLTEPGRFGRVITFIPTGFLALPFFRTALYHELSRRVAAARHGQAG